MISFGATRTRPFWQPDSISSESICQGCLKLCWMLEVRHLRTLQACADAGSFAAAAKELSYTTSAVSQQIAALEREAGTLLVERLARGVRLTEAGSALLVHADNVLAELADAVAELDGLAGRRGGHLRFGSFPTAMSCLGPVVIETFRSRYPAIEPLFVDAEPYEALVALRSRELDLALVFSFDRWGPGKSYDASSAVRTTPLTTSSSSTTSSSCCFHGRTSLRSSAWCGSSSCGTSGSWGVVSRGLPTFAISVRPPASSQASTGRTAAPTSPPSRHSWRQEASCR